MTGSPDCRAWRAAGRRPPSGPFANAAEREGYAVEGFAPTSRAAHRLEEAGINATTLQRFLRQRQSPDPEKRRLFVLDESSLASTRQVNDFLKRLAPKDRVLLVGDTRQHQAVDAGRPFQQMQEAGMRTAHLDQIVRQRDPELKQVVESLATGNTDDAVKRLIEQQRVHEIPDTDQRLKTVAGEYLKDPDTSLVVSPDNQSRLEINRHIHESLQAQGRIGSQDHTLTILVNRHELTGADREWADRYDPGDVIRYTRGSSRIGVKEGEYATVVRIDKRRKPPHRPPRGRQAESPTIPSGSRVSMFITGKSGSFPRASESSSRRRSRVNTSPTESLGTLRRSIPAETSAFAWNPGKPSTSTSASTRTLTTAMP